VEQMMRSPLGLPSLYYPAVLKALYAAAFPRRPRHYAVTETQFWICLIQTQFVFLRGVEDWPFNAR
jgi:hypothetical protein